MSAAKRGELALAAPAVGEMALGEFHRSLGEPFPDVVPQQWARTSAPTAFEANIMDDIFEYSHAILPASSSQLQP